MDWRKGDDTRSCRADGGNGVKYESNRKRVFGHCKCICLVPYSPFSVEIPSSLDKDDFTLLSNKIFEATQVSKMSYSNVPSVLTHS
jgi:hypothetical protein